MKKNKVLVVDYPQMYGLDHDEEVRQKHLQQILEEENKKGWSFVWGGGNNVGCPKVVVLEKQVS